MVLGLQHLLTALLQFFRRGQHVLLKVEDAVPGSEALQVGTEGHHPPKPPRGFPRVSPPTRDPHSPPPDLFPCPSGILIPNLATLGASSSPTRDLRPTSPSSRDPHLNRLPSHPRPWKFPPLPLGTGIALPSPLPSRSEGPRRVPRVVTEFMLPGEERETEEPGLLRALRGVGDNAGPGAAGPPPGEGKALVNPLAPAYLTPLLGGGLRAPPGEPRLGGN